MRTDANGPFALRSGSKPMAVVSEDWVQRDAADFVAPWRVIALVGNQVDMLPRGIDAMQLSRTPA